MAPEGKRIKITFKERFNFHSNKFLNPVRFPLSGTKAATPVNCNGNEVSSCRECNAEDCQNNNSTCRLLDMVTKFNPVTNSVVKEKFCVGE